jgi:undecaprenyl-diphosphatase
METLWYLDYHLFLVLNHLPHTGLLDGIAQFFSWVGGNGIIWALFCYLLFIQEEERDHWFFLPFGLAGTLSVIVTQFVLKPLVGRTRPEDMMGAWVVGGALSDSSFPSSHATFAWALAVVLSREEPRAKWFFYAVAFLISLSRVYLGKHYPTDVLAGFILGSVIGYSAIWLERMIAYHRQGKRRWS